MDLKKSIALLISTYFLLGSSLIIDGNELMNIIEDNGIPFKDFFDYMDDNGLYYEFKEDDPINIYGLSTKDEELNNDNSDSEEEEELNPEAPCSSSQVIAVKKKKASNICQFEDCNIRGSYGYLDKKEKYCKKHKNDDMVYKHVEKYICSYLNCDKLGNYGYMKNGDRWCFKHKKDDMESFRSGKCDYPKCINRASFWFDGDIKKFCGKHKKEDAPNRTIKICSEKDCEKEGIYWVDGQEERYCRVHKKDGAIEQAHKCKYKGCLIQGSYGYSDKKGLFCVNHSKPDMINKRQKLCIECNINRARNPLYQNHCLRCFIYKFPNNTVLRNYKVKEKHVIDFIEDNFPNEFTYGLTINGGCSKKIPDMFKDCITHSIIIEVDEEQHKSYPCENKRMMLLFQDLAERPIVFIRFNPDNYVDKNGNKINSCFKIHKRNGILIIEDKKIWNIRLNELKNKIEYYINNIPEKEVTIEYLFYNE